MYIFMYFVRSNRSQQKYYEFQYKYILRNDNFTRAQFLWARTSDFTPLAQRLYTSQTVVITKITRQWNSENRHFLNGRSDNFIVVLIAVLCNRKHFWSQYNRKGGRRKLQQRTRTIVNKITLDSEIICVSERILTFETKTQLNKYFFYVLTI